MFKWLDEFDKIIVTGPQRSGTTICARMIAYDTGYKFIGENEIGVDNLYRMWSLLSDERHFVVQCPALCRYAHMFSANDIAIILMRRNVQEIIASQKRAGWNRDKVELTRYDCSEGIIAQIKYQFWANHQKAHVKHAFEIRYESLAEHPLWVEEKIRRNPAERTLHQKDNLITSDGDYPCQHPDVFYRREYDHGIAAFTKPNGPIKLFNVTGRLFWSLCDGTRTRQEIVQELYSYFQDVEKETLARDLDEFITTLVSQGFLQLSPGPNTTQDKKNIHL